MESYRQFESDRDRGDFEGLPELHATLSGMKVRRVLATRPCCPSCNIPSAATPGLCLVRLLTLLLAGKTLSLHNSKARLIQCCELQ